MGYTASARLCFYLDSIVFYCYINYYEYIHMVGLSICLRYASLAFRKPYDCPMYSEVTLGWGYNLPTIDNKTQQNANTVNCSNRQKWCAIIAHRQHEWLADMCWCVLWFVRVVNVPVHNKIIHKIPRFFLVLSLSDMIFSSLKNMIDYLERRMSKLKSYKYQRLNRFLSINVLHLDPHPHTNSSHHIKARSACIIFLEWINKWIND